MKKELDNAIHQIGTLNPVQQFSEVFTAEEVSAKFFGGHVSYWTVLDMAKDATLPCIWLGRRPYFYRDSLENWRKEQEGLPYWEHKSRQKNTKNNKKGMN